VVNSIFLGYLLALYLVGQEKQRHIQSATTANRFGAATTNAALLLAWSGLSLLWTPAPASAAPYYLGYLVQVLISYMLCQVYPIRAVLRSVCKGTAYASAASVPLAIVLTGYSGGRLGASSQLSMVAIIAFAACLGVLSITYLLLDRSMSRGMAIFLTVFLLVGLYLAFSKTQIVALAVAGMVYVLVAPGSWRRRLTRIAWMTLGLALVVVSSFSKIAEYQSGSANADTLTGRTILWTQTYTQIVTGPSLRGFGFLAFREVGPVPFHDLDRVVNAHNEFLTLWFNFGVPGVVLVFASYFALGFKSLRSIKGPAGILAVLVLCTVVFSLVRGITEANTTMCDLPLPWMLLLDCLVSSSLAGAVRDSSPDASHMAMR
jgi:O-antigen ligase